MTKNISKGSSIKKSSLNIKKTTSFKTSKKKSKPFLSGKKIKKTVSLKPKATETSNEIPEFVEEAPAVEQVEAPAVEQVEAPAVEQVEAPAVEQVEAPAEAVTQEEVPVGQLDELTATVEDDLEVKVSGFYFGAIDTPAPKGEESEPKPEPVAPVVDVATATEIHMKNQNDEEIRPISIDFSTGPVIKKAVKITQSEMEPIKPEDFKRKPAPSVTAVKKAPVEKPVEDVPVQKAPEKPVKKPVEKIVIATEELPPISATDLEVHLQEEIADLKQRCKELEQEKIEVATAAKQEYKQLSAYLKKDIEELKGEIAEFTEQNGNLLEEIVLLERKVGKLSGTGEKNKDVESKLKSAVKEVEEEFITFIKLADSLFEKLPTEVIKEFLASEQCLVYKKALERLPK